MKKKIVFLILYIPILTLIAKCNSAHKDNEDSIQTIKIDIEKPISKYSKLNLSKIACKANYIKLYTGSNFLIGDIRNIVIKKKIYVQNFSKMLVFNPDGSPAYSIQNQGKGANEYYEINDFYIDTVNRILEVWDRVTHKMFVYNNDNGILLKNYKVNIDGKYFIKKGKYYFFYSVGLWSKSMPKSESAMIYCLDNKGSIINKYLKVKEVGLYSFSSPEFLSEYGREVFFDYAPYGIIYKINEHSCKPVYRIEINGYSMKEKELLSMKDLRAPERFRKLINEYSYSTGKTKINKHCIKLQLNTYGKSFYCFYYPESKKYYTSNIIVEDYYLKIPVWYINICDNKLICWIESYRLLESNNDYEHLKHDFPDLYRTIKSTKKFDNPLLIVCNLKKN